MSAGANYKFHGQFGSFAEITAQVRASTQHPPEVGDTARFRLADGTLGECSFGPSGWRIDRQLTPSGDVQFGGAATAKNLRWSIIGQANRIAAVKAAGTTQCSSRVQFHTPISVGSVKATFRNAIGNGTSINETEINQYLGPVSIVGAYLEIEGVSIPLTFGGSKTATIPVGGEIEHDPIIQYIPAGGVGYYRTDIEIVSGKQMVGQSGRYAPNEGTAYNGSPIGQNTGIAGYTASSGDIHFAPWAIMGLVSQDTYVTIGDSIPWGSGDNGYVPGVSVGPNVFGWARRWLYSHRGHSACCWPGGMITHWNNKTLAPTTRRFIAKSGASHVIFALGINDITQNRTLQNLIDDYTAAVLEIRKAGFLKIGVIKILPKTTSTDAWATTANQTPAAGHEIGGIREQINDWFSTSGLFDFVLDPYAPTVAIYIPGVGWVWAAGQTSDGIHPKTTAHAFIAAAMPDPASIGIYST